MADEVVISVRAEDNFSSVLGNFGSIMTGIESVVNMAASAFNFAKDVIGDFVNSASESEQATARLEGVLRATGGAAGLSSEQLQSMANELQGVTRFSDETILAGESLLLTFRNITGETFERTVPAMVDMAEIFGSVDSAAMQLGKALNDPVAGLGALTRAGITFSDEQKEMIKNFVETGDMAAAQNIILTEVENQVSGLAETMGDTFSGKVAIFNNALDTAKETIGGVFLPVLGNMIDGFMDAIPAVQNFAEAFATAMSTGDFTDLFATFEDGSSYLGALAEAFGLSEESAYALGDALNDLITDFDVTALGETLLEAVDNIDWGQLSQDVADGINSIDWGHVGNTIAEALGYIAIAIGQVLSEVDWPALLGSMANAIADFISGLFGFVDWNDMISSAMVGFEYLETEIEDWVVGIGRSISNWWGNIDWGGLGESILEGVMNGLDSMTGGLASKFINIAANFVNAFKSFLGISSPSTVFIQIGRDIIQGLINGFTAAWDSLMSIAENSLAEFFSIFGVDFSDVVGGSLGTHNTGGTDTRGSTGTTGGGTSTGASSSGGGTVNNYFYGPVSFNGLGEIGYDCPSPNPLLAASQTLNTSGV